MVACHRGHSLCVHLLLTHNASVTQVDSKGLCALHYAAYSGSVDCLMLLLQQKTEESNSKAPGGVNFGDPTPLVIATK